MLKISNNSQNIFKHLKIVLICPNGIGKLTLINNLLDLSLEKQAERNETMFVQEK